MSPDLEFADEAISGAKHDREGFEALMQAARAGRIKVLFFENLSRLARDCVLTLQTLRELVYVCKVRIVSVDEGIDSETNGSWELLAVILGLQNEQYLKALAKFVFRGQEGVVLEELCVGDYPFGYSSEPIPGSEKLRKGRNPKPKKRYIIIPEEAAWVQLIFDWFVNFKWSIRRITRELNRCKAAKGSRAKSPVWQHQYVAELLRRVKYIGVWPWGLRKNVRDFKTGEINIEYRTDEETQKWLRHLPKLAIVDRDLFDKAQVRLSEIEAALAPKEPREDGQRGRLEGRLQGSTSASAEVNPRHLLSCLVRCECGRRLHVGGTKGKYLFCPNYLAGLCGCKTTLRRDLAEALILAEIGKCILTDQALRDALLEMAQCRWNELDQNAPAKLEATERALADLDHTVSRLVSLWEREEIPEIGQRLAERRKERMALEAELAKLRNESSRPTKAPTAEWVNDELTRLHEVLREGDSAAAIALRALVGGAIDVREVRREGKDRHYLQGRFEVSLQNLAQALDAPAAIDGDAEPKAPVRVIVIDFREEEEYEALADSVMEDFKAGMKFKQIAVKHGCGRALIARAFEHWHTSRGLEPPDARSLRGRLTGHQPDELMEKIMKLYHADVPNQEIADQVGCCKDTVTAKVKASFLALGLPMPDGRARRKQLRLKRERGDDTRDAA